ncbi:bifunctional diguanylate cyclase/phosphodiesterase [Thiohalobacter sp. IOR34]|uniref:putative bifunctional diguanylate cyclase/phosphodiesterase n=1 Tax=Thiohalobacter sp. IOR34 TaxID=3057176 RepID=UPI0025B11E46|nr:bifunctional diguanylate cyclase/phosphodiesterase [Thiohalobacter sp. IOR34]WJW75915.1 bifunctional diguanylate cyclase/phosphodiesterase [Thiohalobacter sp. IOR34]
MRLVTQILLAVVGITVLSQLAFAYMAYLMMADSERQFRSEVLAHEVRELTEGVAVPLAIGDGAEEALERIRQQFAPASILAMLVGKGEVLAMTGPGKDTLDAELFGRLRHEAEQAQSLRQGEVSLGGRRLYWVAMPMTALPYHLLMLSPEDGFHFETGALLSSRLIATGLIVTWCAVWVAMVLASLISRRLKEKNAALRHQMTHDPLTGLPNRALLQERLSELLAPSTDIHSLALLVVNINGFREINDTLGHHFGDMLLLEVGARLRDMLSDQEAVARLGADEFAILLPDATETAACEMAEAILRELHNPITVSEVDVAVSVRIGIALYPQHVDDIGALVRYADVAEGQAKQKACHYVVYDGADDRFSVRRLSLGAGLRRAIERNELVLHYQPKIALASGRVTGLEALVRWEHPELGRVAPDEFITLAEQTGAINAITDWVLEESLRFLNGLRTEGGRLGVAVNISTHSLHDPSFPEHVRATLQRLELPGECLCLEITESAMMQDITQARDVLQLLHDMGVHISIDDFGTGFSSFAYLARLPVDELKIDRSFVSELPYHRNDQVLVSSIVEMAHKLGYAVVAEGVEDITTLKLLEGLGCDTAQGYFISRPLPGAELGRWLTATEGELGATDRLLQEPGGGC